MMCCTQGTACDLIFMTVKKKQKIANKVAKKKTNLFQTFLRHTKKYKKGILKQYHKNIFATTV